MIPTVFKSRTVWTIIVLFVVNGVSAVRNVIPPFWLPVVDAVLALAAIYFRANARVRF